MKSRPGAFFSFAGQTWRFYKAHYLAKFYLTEAKGYFLGKNVRIQNTGCFLAERPHGKVSIGDDSIIYEKAKIFAYGEGQIEIGPSSIIGETQIHARGSVKFGARVVTSWNVFIQDFDPHPVDPDLRKQQLLLMCENFTPSYRERKPMQALAWKFSPQAIEIGNDVWLGANTTILKGAKIGDGCVVATGAVVVSGTYPERSILAGVPAKVLKSI